MPQELFSLAIKRKLLSPTQALNLVVLKEDDNCADALTALAAYLPEYQSQKAIRAMVETLERLGRNDVMQCVERAASALSRIGGKTVIQEVCGGIQDVAVWWP